MTSLNFAQYADWIADRLGAANVTARSWHGQAHNVHRVYFGREAYIEVTAREQNYGHACTALPRWYKSPTLVRALTLLGEDVLTIDADEIGVRGPVPVASTEAPARHGFVGTEDGATATLSLFSAARPDLDAHLGTVRITKSGDAWYVLGASAAYRSVDDDNEEQIARSGWYMRLTVRQATAEEAAPVLAEREIRVQAEAQESARMARLAADR